MVKNLTDYVTIIYYRTLSLLECDLNKPVTYSYKVENNQSFLKSNQKKSTVQEKLTLQ